MSGQCTPWPVPISRQFARCAGVASDNRQDHASGTLITRPSARCAMISSLVTRMSWTTGSLLATMFMPGLQNRSSMLLDRASNHIQVPGAEAVVASKSEWNEPELTGLVLALDMHVRWFITVEAREKETIRSWNPCDSWHSRLLPRLLAYRQLQGLLKRLKRTGAR